MTDWRHEDVSSLESLYIDARRSRRIRALAHARLCVEERPRRKKRRGLSTFVIAVVAFGAAFRLPTRIPIARRAGDEGDEVTRRCRRYSLAVTLK